MSRVPQVPWDLREPGLLLSSDTREHLGFPGRAELSTAQIAAPGARGTGMCCAAPASHSAFLRPFSMSRLRRKKRFPSTRGHRQDEQDYACGALCAPQNINIYEVLYYYSSFLENTRGQDKDTVNSHHLFVAKSSNDLGDYNSPYRTGGVGPILPD